MDLRLDIVDVYGDRLQEPVDVALRHQVLRDRRLVRVNARRRTVIKDLLGAPQGLYRLEVDPPSYLPVSRFVSIPATGSAAVAVTCPINPNRVGRVDFPAFASLADELKALLGRSRSVFGFSGMEGEDLYRALDDVRRAGLLNIEAKCRATPLSNGRTVSFYLAEGELSELRGDRFFAKVPRALREETKNSVADELFHPVDASLHHPPAGFTHAGSFKTAEAYGNLQLTFFMNDAECVADVDIDDAAGLGHVFQVFRNTLTGRPTHPYDVHEILVSYQGIDPGYRLRPTGAQDTAATTGPGRAA